MQLAELNFPSTGRAQCSLRRSKRCLDVHHLLIGTTHFEKVVGRNAFCL
jgi:hypothetical protein